jgi:predicted amidohydrolase YtcJ
VSSNEAELVLGGGRIRTSAHPSGFAAALAIRDGVIQAVGSDDEMRELTGRRTRVIDLRGRLALPAFGDAHVHPVGGGLESLRCNLVGLRSRQDCLDAVARYCEALAPGAWVLGGGWTMTAFPGGLPTAADLDTVTGGRPAFLPNRDHHSAWVNTAAMAIAGLDTGTPDPVDGRIERDESGRPAGALHDGAMRLIAPHVPAPTEAELLAGLVAGQSHLHSLGITSFQDACVGAAGELGIPDAFGTYLMAADYGMLDSHVVGALWWDELAEAARRLGAEGFQLHFHAIGDLAVSTALDALAALPAPQRQAARHHLAHLQFITPRDMGRFAELGAVANFQPLWACSEIQMEELTLPFVGPERARWQYQIGSLLDLGTRIAFGSDWPVSSADPLQEIHVAVNRVLSERLGRPGQPETENPFLPSQAITVEAAVDAFTSGVAWVNHSEDVAGRLLPGMRADVAVLDQDLFTIPPRDIGSTSVAMTVAGGTVVHGDR